MVTLSTQNQRYDGHPILKFVQILLKLILVIYYTELHLIEFEQTMVDSTYILDVCNLVNAYHACMTDVHGR